MKPTAKQVAQAAGVSLSAVSRAFLPGSPLDAAKRQRILAVAAKLGYASPARRTAEAIAASTVTLVAGDLGNPFYPMVLDTLAKQLQLSQRQLLVYAVPAQEDVDAMLPQILAQRPSAVIVTSARLTSAMARACRRNGIKVVLINRIQRDMKMNAVSCDNYGGGRDVARLFAARGRTRIGFIGGIANTSTHAERARGFRDGLREAGLSLQHEVAGNFTYNEAYAAALRLLASRSRPDALFCCNDIMGLAAIDAAREKGLRPGEDIAIVGFDDIPMAGWTSYRLTTIRQPVERMVQEALSIIDDPAIRPGDDGSVRILPGKLTIRASG
ncbi:substrate-binding domain-containing protein [Rhizobium sp. AQ_MP]|uniref:substrate-binding domain-containing protein n=1 Tax=Rhizobium sp. AQ_MP TaxID=2761536 RepID=UPI00163B0949|nr:substrate-binding domain-containing protein [Rhizobium sp. AQ_MP]